MKRIAIGIELEWPYEHHYDVVQGVLEYGKKVGWECCLEPGLETTPDINALPSKFDGIIARAPKSLVDLCKRDNVPLINVWANTDATDVKTITTNRFFIGEMAAKYFVSRGFRNVGFLGRLEERGTTLQFEGAKQYLEKYDFELSKLILSQPVTLTDWQDFNQKVGDWMKQQTLPFAVICSDNLSARYFCEWCLRNQYMVPDDVAIVCTKYNRLICDSFEPSITSIVNRFNEVGYQAARLLDNLMANEEDEVDWPVFIKPGEILERRSTDVEPVEDRLIARAMRYIWDHSHEPLQVDDVVRPLSINRRSLERRFRKVLKRTINEEIMRSRIERAKRILEESDDTVKSVAKASGFSSGQRMAQVFKQHLGMMPTEYRLMHQSQNT